ncbi:MAG: ATPase, T2SS/T4P/T4SS family [archaeon]
MTDNLIARIFEGAAEYGASDIHIKTDMPVKIRVQGVLDNLTDDPVDATQISSIVETLLIPEKMNEFEIEKQTDSSYSFGENRYRVNTFRDENGISLAIRTIPSKIRKVEEVGFPYKEKVWRDIIGLKKGLVLVCGATNSGKSTTNAALIQRINETRGEHILTIEDPIEYIYSGGQSIISQREIGRHVNSFERGLEAALREDPNIWLIGEIKNNETAKIALQAANSGHLVFTTLHSGDSGQAIWEYASRFPPEEQEAARKQLADSLKYVLCQRLIPYESGQKRTLIMEVANVGHSSAVENMIRKGEYNTIVDQISREKDNYSISMAQHAATFGFELEE